VSFLKSSKDEEFSAIGPSRPLDLSCYGAERGSGDRREIMSLSIEELAGQYHEAWADLDPDTIVALHTEDSTFHLHGMAEPAVGREAVRGLIASLVTLVPDLHFAAKRGYLGTDHIVLEYDMSETFSETHFVCDGVDVFSVVNGLMARKDSYLDLATLVNQIGSLPKVGVSV